MTFSEFIVPFSFFLIVAIDAYTDSNRVVNHKRGFVIYASACVILSCVFIFLFNIHWYYCFSFSLLTRLAFFDPILNSLKGRKFTYEGDINAPQSKRSWFDRLEDKIPLSTFWKRIIYIAKYAGFLIYYFL